MITPPSPWCGRRFRGLRIGLLGGSFNPAHGGHRALSLAALETLDLDQIWWLVSPQNPLKSHQETLPKEARLVWARAMADDPRLVATDLESQLGTRYTIDTLRALSKRFSGTRFVWLMGADNLAQIHRWRGWEAVFRQVPVAVFARPTYSLGSLFGPAASRFRKRRRTGRRIARLPSVHPPAWTFVSRLNDPRSATALRRAGRIPETPQATASNATETTLPSAAFASPHTSPSQPMIDAVVHSLDQDKATDIVTIDLSGKAGFADAMVVACGRSTRQVAAMAEKLSDRLREAGFAKPKTEGMEAADWVILDAGDVIVHIFRPEVRAFYGIEKMWDPDGKAPRLNPAPEEPIPSDTLGYQP